MDQLVRARYYVAGGAGFDSLLCDFPRYRCHCDFYTMYGQIHKLVLAEKAKLRADTLLAIVVFKNLDNEAERCIKRSLLWTHISNNK